MNVGKEELGMGWGVGPHGCGWGGARTCGVGEQEGDSLVWDATHIAHRHLAGVAGIVLGPQVLQLQDFRLSLGDSGLRE